MKYKSTRPLKSIYDLEEIEPNDLISKRSDGRTRQNCEKGTRKETSSSSSEDESELEELFSKRRNRRNSKNKKKKKEESSSYDEESEDSQQEFRKDIQFLFLE